METFQLNSTEKEFYDKIQAELLDTLNTKAPNTPISKVKQEALDTFLDRRWVLETQKNFLSIKQEDLMKISESYGPDLTMLPRSRYHNFGKKPQKTGPKPLSAYQIFFKDHVKDPDLQKVDPKERTKIIAEMWKQQKNQ